MSRRIQIEIEEMVLEGVPPSDRDRFADAFRVELERLFRDGAGDEPEDRRRMIPAAQAARAVYEEVERCMPGAGREPEAVTERR